MDSCYNAFSRIDMRVHVAIPGSVESYCIDERGDKRVATDELWLETYLCSVLRAYAYADDGSGDTIRKIMGVRRFNPVTTTETEHRFLQAAEQLFFRGIVTYGERLFLALTADRLATWLGLGCPGSKQRIKSSHHWSPEIFSHYGTICFRHQSFREAPNEEH
jgi:hypothetical protein